jgi:metal-dependent amidase/aminoacylase/carboxypeptidase family protein
LQTIVARRLDPAETAVVSVTEIVTDGARNVLPGQARIRGDARSFSHDVSARIEAELREIAEGVARAYRLSVDVDYTHEFVPLINDEGLAEEMLAAAREALGPERVAAAEAPITASEDFAAFLADVPGCFAFLGNGVESAPLHNPGYDFNDAILADGARVFAAIARRRLPPAG